MFIVGSNINGQKMTEKERKTLEMAGAIFAMIIIGFIKYVKFKIKLHF